MSVAHSTQQRAGSAASTDSSAAAATAAAATAAADGSAGDEGDTMAGHGEITFIRPIPGFTGLTRFVLVRPVGQASVISELRSLESPDVRFVVATPSAFFTDYAFELDEQDGEQLGLTSAEDALILTILTVGHDASSSTANLLAPMVINVRTRMAAQVILAGSDWPVRAPLG